MWGVGDQRHERGGKEGFSLLGSVPYCVAGAGRAEWIRCFVVGKVGGVGRLWWYHQKKHAYPTNQYPPEPSAFQKNVKATDEFQSLCKEIGSGRARLYRIGTGQAGRKACLTGGALGLPSDSCGDRDGRAWCEKNCLPDKAKSPGAVHVSKATDGSTIFGKDTSVDQCAAFGPLATFGNLR